MIQSIYEISANTQVANDIFEMRLSGDTSALTKPGQFVNIRLDGRFLRRPISVCCFDNTEITLLYKVVGEGTAQMSHMHPGMSLDLLVGLGNGFDTSKSGNRPLLIGGGMGIAPLYGLCRALVSEGKSVTAALGFNTLHDTYYIDRFKALGACVLTATADGSIGVKGFVTQLVPQIGYTYFYTCGPMPMLEAVNRVVNTQGQLSFEERMGCGFGACMGCSCQTLTGSKRICRDGPIMERSEILWPTHA